MRLIILLLASFPLFSSAQKIALLDRNFYEPITMVDTITSDAAARGGLAVYRKDIAMVIESMEELAKDLDSKKLTPRSMNMTLGNSTCIVITEKAGNKYSLNIVFNTTAENIKTSVLLADHETSKRALQRLTIFIDYLRNNTSAMSNYF